MKIVSWNVNGLRSIVKKNLFYSFVDSHDADVICIQESRCLPEQIKLDSSFLEKYPFQIWNSPHIKKGYSGTVIFSKILPNKSFKGIGIHEHDQEGRVITVEFDSFFLVNVYVPNSKSDLSRLHYRINEWDYSFREYLINLDSIKSVIITGDFNSIINERLDIHNPKIKNVAGATEEEKKSICKYLDHFVDSFRYTNPTIRKYSWWSNFGKSREKNNGWRIDYFFLSKCLEKNILVSDILDSVMGSDHAPCVLVLNCP
jgi:exodeoxyribonuclease-3